MKRLHASLAVFVLLSSCAPVNYNYGNWSVTHPSQAFQLQPNDACKDQRLASAGALQYMNATVGKPDGFPKSVTSISSISSQGYGPPLGFDAGPPAQVQCYETVIFNDGTRQTGTVEMTNENEGLVVTWTQQPSPKSAQQSAKDALAGEQFEGDLQECSDEYTEKMGEMSNLSLQAEANGTPFDVPGYVKGAEHVLISCQQAASQQYHSVVGEAPSTN